MAMPPIPSPETVRRQVGTLPDGRTLESFVLRAGAVELEALSWGCVVSRLRVPDRHGTRSDVVLGYAEPLAYLTDPFCLGAVVGRFANRIAAGRFLLDGECIHLPRNNAPAGISCHLHGGEYGFHRRLWQGEPLAEPGVAGVRFHRQSPHGEEGYPGNLDVSVTYRLTTGAEWSVEYQATTDRPTVVNLTQHSFFNLAGDGAGDILDHTLTVHADHYAAVDAGLIPRGPLAPVVDTPFDFRRPRRIGAHIGDPHPQLAFGNGYDHAWALHSAMAPEPRPAARLHDPHSGRTLDVMTTEPALQVYTGNFLRGSRNGRSGQPLFRHAGICLETQHFPDSPNRGDFPPVILRPGTTWRSLTVFRFGVETA